MQMAVAVSCSESLSMPTPRPTKPTQNKKHDIPRQERPPIRSTISPQGAAAASDTKNATDASKLYCTNCASQHFAELPTP